jgi:hypothetical protein
MPETLPAGLAAALSYPGLIWLVMAALVAGAVRGFAGFGAALVFLPVAGAVLPPIWALIALTVMDVFGPLPTLRRTVPQAQLHDVAWLWLGMALALPLGVMVLVMLDPDVFRYVVSIAGIAVTLILIAGFRYRGPMTPPVMVGTGALSGFLGGVAGVPGPPVILLYMASPSLPVLIRANTMVFLFLFDLTLLALIAVRGDLMAAPVWIGLLLAIPTMLGTLLGTAIFDPARAGVYRLAGYVIVMASALSGLPFWR